MATRKATPAKKAAPRRRVKKAAPPAEVRRLGTAGRTECSVAVTSAPWDLRVDALVISVGPDGSGRLGAAFLESARTGLAYPSPPVTLDRPGFGRLAPRDYPGLRIVLTTVRDPRGASPDEESPATIDAARRAAAACVRFAASNGLTRLAMPLIGAGTAGLDPAAVADAVVASVRVALADLGDQSPLREVVFVGENEESASLVEAAWQGYRSQPFANDRPEGPDLLGVRDEVSALADMLLLREVQPPLAVGVLGGWGSGKSFVMRLMRDRLDEVRAARLTEAECWDGAGVSPFVGHVYPIEFNAWTYARADLWAALMQSTLSELDRQLAVERRIVAAGRGLLDGTEWQKVRALPEELHKLYAETKQPRDTADLFATLNAVHQTERTALNEKQQHLAELRAQEVAAERDVEARVDAVSKVEVDAARWAPFRKVLAGVVGAAEQDVQKWLASTVPESTTQDAKQLATALRGLRPPDRKVAKTVVRQHVAAALVFAFAALLAPVVLVWWRHALGEFTLSAGVIAATAGVSSFARLVSGWVGVGRRFADQLGVWQRSVEEDVRRIEQAREKQVDATKQADPALTEVRLEIARTEQDVEHLKQRVGLVGEFRSVDDLLKARLESGTYEQRLGVMQQISSDLASISRSLTTGERDVDRDAKRKLFPRGPARVVLFIDDLDRCPPAKVVEVLEAVQLLLATNLFVVVVALDVRYVTKALEKEYEGVLDAGGEPSGADYLEKIIQVPYRTRSLTTDAARRFLSGQLRVSGGTTSPGDDPGGPTAGRPEPERTETAPEATRSAAAVARDIVFTPDEVDVLAAACTLLALSPRAGKRVGNVTKLFRMVWARRGCSSPTLDETGTVALLVGLAAAHPEVQRDALAYLNAFAQGPAAPSRSVAVVLSEMLKQLETPEQTRWQAAVAVATGTAVFDEGEHEPFRLGGAPVADVAAVVDFVAAFCFVAEG